MPTISGSVIFDRNRNNIIDAGDSGLANVQIVLQNINTNVRLVVSTDVNGNFSFINVPNGSYRLVEAYGTTGGVATPGDFNLATVGAIPVGEDPPIAFAFNPPAGSTNLDSLSPNTLFLTVSGANITNQIYFDGPVIYTPISSIIDPCITISNINLITSANNGTFGSYPAGTAANTGVPGTAANPPYPGVTPDFTYVLPNPFIFAPDDGQYAIQNIMTNNRNNNNGVPGALNTWWRIADHTTGDETGRFLLVNGFNPGAVFFQQTVVVNPQSYYLFSSWIMNIVKDPTLALPQLGVQILDENNNIIYQQTLGNSIPVNTQVPEWKEIGTIISSGNNTVLTVKFISQGPAAAGNDYAIDDISLREAGIPDLSPIKAISKSIASIGETVTYTITLSNTCSSPLTNVTFLDTVPTGLSFINGTTTGGLNPATDNPNIGFSVGTINGNSSATITFKALVQSIPNPNPINNIATMNYLYSPVQGGIANSFIRRSNLVPVTVNTTADVAIMKTASSVIAGSVLTYTIVASNNGPSSAVAVVVTDNIPSAIVNPQFSVNGGTFSSWTGSTNIGTLPVGSLVTIVIRGTVTSGTIGNVVNTVTVSSTTSDPNLNNNSSTVTTPVGVSADIAVVKTSTAAVAGNILTYTIVATNNGPSDATSVVVSDNIPSSIVNSQFSLNGGTFSSWTGSTNIGTLTVGALATIVIRGTIASGTVATIVNTVTIASPTPDSVPGNNSSTVTTPVGVSADIAVVKTSTAAVAGNILTYTIVATNNGPSDAASVIVSDNIPSSIVNSQFSLNGGAFSSWTGSTNIGTLTVGALATIVIRGTVASGTVATIINTVTVASPTPDSVPGNNSSTVTTPVGVSADLAVVKSSTAAVAGNILTYTIVATNNGPSDAVSVVVNDNIPSSIVNPQFALNGGAFSSWAGSTNIGTLTVGALATIVIRGTVASGTVATIVNIVTIVSPTPDLVPGNNSSTVTTPVGVSADIAVVKTSGAAIAGNILTYTIVATNNGPSDAVSVLVRDTIPNFIISPQYSVNAGIFNNWTGSVNIGTLLVGALVTIVIKGTINPSAVGTIINTVTIVSPTPDSVPGNNSSTVTTPVGTSADLAVVKSSTAAIAGNILTYTIVATNNGPSDAVSVVINDNIPNSIVNPQFSLNGGAFNSWTGTTNIGTLPVGAVVTIVIKGTVNSAVTGVIGNTVTITSPTPDTVPGNNNSTVTTPVGVSADIAVVKTSTAAVAGNILTYTIVATNNGPSDAVSVVINDNIPSSIINPQFSFNGGVFNSWTGSANIGNLSVGALATIVIKGTVNSAVTATIVNTATVVSPTPDTVPGNNNSTVTTPVGTSADIAVIKTSTAALAGNILTYTIVARNNGPSDAVSVVVNDNVPSSIANPQFSLNGGVFNNWTGSINIGTLPVATLATIVIRGTVRSGVTGTIVNTATVVSPTPDTVPGNNNSTVTTPVGTSADIVVVKTSTAAIAGNVLTYTIVASNNGPSDAASVLVSDNVPSSIVNPQFSLNGGIFNSWTGSINIGTLPVGTLATIVIRGTVNSATIGTIVNTVTVASPTPDTVPGNNNSTVTVPVKAIADVAINKTASAVIAGNVLTYTIVASNNGPSDAVSVVVTDNIPVGVDNPTFSINSGSFSNWTGMTTLGTLKSGQLVTIIIKGTVNSSVVNSLVNTVTILSGTEDPVPGNNSSTATVPVTAIADLKITKIADPIRLNRGNIVNYNILIENLGPSDAVSVLLTDSIVAGIINPEYSIDKGISYKPWTGNYNLGTIAKGSSSNLLIRGLIAMSVIGTVPNTATITAQTIDPDISNNHSTANVLVIYADLLAPGNFVKSVDKLYGDIGEVLTYTIVVKNTGNTIANNVVILDSIPNGTSYVDGSLIASAAISGLPQSGILISNGIAAGAIVTVSYQVKVDTIPNPNPIPNEALITYNYTSNPNNPNGERESGLTNKVTTKINHGEILPENAVKTVDKILTTSGDILTYSISLKNTGNTLIDNVQVIDLVPMGTSFVLGSVAINNIRKPSENPNLGINVGAIASAETVLITFKVIVLDSAVAPLLNKATVNYSYIIDPTKPEVKNTVETNEVRTDVIKANLELVKTSDRIGAVVGDIIRYSIVATNSGEVDLFNLTIKDNLNSYVQFVGNVTIDSVSISGNINSGINIGTLAINQSKILAFDVKVIAIPVDKLIKNISEGSYSYMVLNNTFTKITNSNENIVRVYNPVLAMSKVSNFTAIKVGESFNYDIIAKNLGDIALNNVIITDNLPDVFEVTEILLDNIPISGDIKKGINIGSLLIDQDKHIKLIIKVIEDLPNGGFKNIALGTATAKIDPNKPETPVKAEATDNNEIVVYEPELALFKSVTKKYVTVGEIITYTIIAKNIGNMDLGNVDIDPATVYDLLSPGLEFVDGTVKVNGISEKTATIISGIDIGSLKVQEMRTISFDAKVVSAQYKTIENTANATFGYQLPGRKPEIGSAESNTVIVIPEVVNIDVNKVANKELVILGDIITYNVTLKNTGIIDALNVIFKDSLPKEVELLQGSFKVNGVLLNSVNLVEGVNISNIPVGKEVKIEYKVKVISNNCNFVVLNSAKVKFDYILPDNSAGSTESKSSSSSIASVKTGLNNFKQISVEEKIIIPNKKPDIEEISSVTGEIKILNLKTMKTNNGTSNEGQNLTGYKLMIHGVIKEFVEYTALDNEQTVHSAEYYVPFTTFIVLSSSNAVYGKLNITGEVEHIYFKQLNSRELFSNATILVNLISCN